MSPENETAMGTSALEDRDGLELRGANHPEEGSAEARSHPTLGLRLAIWGLNLGPVLLLLGLLIVLAFTVPYFATERNATHLLQQSSVIAMLALGQLVVMLARGIDISAAGQVGFASVVGAVLFTEHGTPGGVVILAVLGMTASIGVLNGVILVFGRMPHPFIVTIGTYSILRGLAYVVSPQAVPGAPDALASLGSSTVLGLIPMTAVVVAVAAMIVGVLLSRSRWGRWVYAIGGSPEAARRTGIPVNGVLISTYVVSGLCAGLAALIGMGIGEAGDPSASTDALLDAIVAVVIGGASFLGGRGNAFNPIVGALIIGTIRNALGLLGVNSFYQFVALGLALLLAMSLDVQRARLVERLRVMRALEAESRHA